MCCQFVRLIKEIALKNRALGIIAAVSILSMFCSGCSLRPKTTPIAPSSERSQKGQLKTVDMRISRNELLKALQQGSPTNNIRLVKVFRGSPGNTGTAEEPPPEYRFFDVKPGSAYQVLGIRNNDILVTAHDRVVYKPENFPEYVKLLLNAPRGWIEIRRMGEPLLLNYSIN